MIFINSDKRNFGYSIDIKYKGKIVIQKNEIILKLKELKPLYSKDDFIIQGLLGSYSRDEATNTSDIDILVESTTDFASRYGFKAISTIFGIPVNLADSSGMGRTAKKFIIDRAI